MLMLMLMVLLLLLATGAGACAGAHGTKYMTRLVRVGECAGGLDSLGFVVSTGGSRSRVVLVPWQVRNALQSWPPVAASCLMATVLNKTSPCVRFPVH